ncbi:MAG TPA: hypothetical protein PLN21_06345 [Gemmatales bacterium]|nr:hypothetical protein [Gemmatales bacterium]
MNCVIFLTLLLQPPANQESVLWSFKVGQEFFVEETQRHLFQAKNTALVTSYFDYTYLWRYFIVSEKNGQFTLQATLEKVRVNNPNEAGAKAIEALKQHEGSKSSWLLVRNETGWTAEPVPGERGRHAVPYFLTVGTPRLTDQQDSWNQLWKVPIADWGDANMDMTITIKQRVNDRLLTTVRTKMEWPVGKTSTSLLEFQPNGSTLAGLGEFDFTRSRWVFFEFRIEGIWQVTRQGVSGSLKQNSYCAYRLFERRPAFP